MCAFCGSSSELLKCTSYSDCCIPYIAVWDPSVIVISFQNSFLTSNLRSVVECFLDVSITKSFC